MRNITGKDILYLWCGEGRNTFRIETEMEHAFSRRDTETALRISVKMNSVCQRISGGGNSIEEGNMLAQCSLQFADGSPVLVGFKHGFKREGGITVDLYLNEGKTGICRIAAKSGYHSFREEVLGEFR